MSMLQFMPWSRIDKSYSVNEVNLIPYNIDKRKEGEDEHASTAIKTILSSYKDLNGNPVKQFALVQYGKQPILADRTEDELAIARECVDIACFCGLAKRDYFTQLGHYCNSDCFILYAQKFNELDFVSIGTRRREGRTLSAWPIADINLSIPVHVSPINKVILDDELLTALARFKDDPESAEEWPHWHNAIACYNQANTDNEVASSQVEWVLLCSAFERILDAKPKAVDVAEKFAAAFVPNAQLLTQNSKRRLRSWTNNSATVRYEWMKEFYRIRGDFAHGKFQSKQPRAWEPHEHIVLASIAFPLLVRALLQKKKLYAMADQDQLTLDVFEKLEDEKFMDKPPDQKSNIDTVWSRLHSEAAFELATRKAIEQLEKKGFFKGDA